MSRSRYDRILEQVYDNDDELVDAIEATNVDPIQRAIDTENAKFWAYYRALDCSQSGVIDMVNTNVETSQSSVSRIIRDYDDRVLHDSDALEIVGRRHEEDFKNYPDEWLEAYRDALAEAFVNVEALCRVASPEKRTPRWAAERYPELVGVYNRVAKEWGIEDSKIHHDTHLSGMESVNIARWARKEISGLSD